ETRLNMKTLTSHSLRAGACFALLLSFHVSCKEKPKSEPAPAQMQVMAGKVPAPTPAARPAKPTCPTGMIQIDGGKFFMGSDAEDALPFEKPSHSVTLSPYCIDKNEVTANQYKACADTGTCSKEATVNDWDGIKPNEKKAFDTLCNLKDTD